MTTVITINPPIAAAAIMGILLLSPENLQTNYVHDHNECMKLYKICKTISRLMFYQYVKPDYAIISILPNVTGFGKRA